MRMTEQRWGVLHALSDGRPARARDVRTRMVDAGFADEQVKTMGGFPFHYLVEGGLIERHAIGVYAITAAGRNALHTGSA